MAFGSEDDKGATGAAKFVTSTVGNTVGGLGKTVGGVVGAGGRGLGQTVTAATGSAGKPVGEAIESLGNGVENGANNVSKGYMMDRGFTVILRRWKSGVGGFLSLPAHEAQAAGFGLRYELTNLR
ncbi:MAG: hypothetical protein Q9194_000721 [Teloschistes cf. exilis]